MTTTYAIVDLETTGTDKKTERIIQFGCVLVEDGEIVSRFATDINPGKTIPKHIQKLTNITNRRVHKAPYFEDVAETIYHFLANTTFVAHNVHFDYHFLNAELVRCGWPPLTIPGIDTVELAQIFMPTQQSFRLGDLAQALGYTHENPHQADSDAEVTAKLLLHIEEQIQKLPIVTFEQIVRLSTVTSMQTHDYLARWLHHLQEKPQPLAKDVEIVGTLALRQKTVTPFEPLAKMPKYPQSKKAKIQLFKEKFTFRSNQNRLMNLIYRHFTDELTEKDLLIEAPTGMGKTFGYLLPSTYVATPENPVIISTSAIVLQHQIVTKELTALTPLLKQPVRATVVKSQRHYLDLQRFVETLKQPVGQKQYAMYQMSVLVWLLLTETGDFDELQLTNYQHQFFHDVAHRGLQHILPQQQFYAQDFLRFRQAQMRQSNVLIVNHAFLVRESQRAQFALPASAYLIIDEAHQLPAVAEAVGQQFVDTNRFRKEWQQMNIHEGLWAQMLAICPNETHQLQLYHQTIQALIEAQEDLWSLIRRVFPMNEEQIVTQVQMEQIKQKQPQIFKSLATYYQDAETLQTQLVQQLQLFMPSLLPDEFRVCEQVQAFFAEVTNQAKTMQTWLHDWDARYVHRLTILTNQSMQCTLHDFHAALLPETKWYERYARIVYLGGTLKVPGKHQYFAQRLGLSEATFKALPTQFDYAEQAKVFVLPQGSGVSIPQMTNDEYAQYLAETLQQLLIEVKQSTLVLFTSYDILQSVYAQTHQAFAQQGREVLPQAKSGSREKLLKRFAQTKNGILYGVDSFWEGIDLPGDLLKVVVVTRLPFENPERATVKARHTYLTMCELNPFQEDTLPKASLKLRQAFGRLLRSENDRGVMILLDRRIVTTKYGRRLAKALPKECPIETCAPAEIAQQTQTFLNHTGEESTEHA